jgi:4Fe-4S ferredoxin
MMNISEFKGNVFVIKRVIDGNTKRKLTYDPSLCFGCELCSTVCPQNAIKLFPLAYMFIGRPRVRIDSKNCILCGICSEICPSGALKVEGARIRLKKLFFADFECEDCRICVDECPWDAIKEVKTEGKKTIKEWVEEQCIFCGRCAKFCPDDKIFVEKPISGEVIIGEDCKFCGVCKDICPSHAISFDGRRMIVDMDICILCGACKNACPTKVIEIRRNEVRIESAYYPWFSQHEKALKSIVREV